MTQLLAAAMAKAAASAFMIPVGTLPFCIVAVFSYSLIDRGRVPGIKKRQDAIEWTEFDPGECPNDFVGEPGQLVGRAEDDAVDAHVDSCRSRTPSSDQPQDVTISV